MGRRDCGVRARNGENAELGIFCIWCSDPLYRNRSIEFISERRELGAERMTVSKGSFLRITVLNGEKSCLEINYGRPHEKGK